MEAIGTHGLKTRMQSTAPKPPTTDGNKQNIAYCDIDIISAYQSHKKHRSGKSRHVKEHAKDATKAARTKPAEKSDLSKRIEDLTARNEQIKQMLISSSQAQPTSLPAKVSDGGGREEKKRSHHHHREHEHQSRRSTHQEATQDLIVPMTQRKKEPKAQRDLPEEDKAETSEKLRHRSRKERNLTQSEPAPSRKPDPIQNSEKVLLHYSNFVDSRKDYKEPCKDSKIYRESSEPSEDLPVPESKSQLLKLVNYATTKSIQRESTKHEIITVYENENIIEETDSIMSKDDFKNTPKSYTMASSFTQDSTSARYDVPLQTLYEKPVREPKEPFEKLTEQVEQHLETATVNTINPRKELSFSNLNLEPNIYHYISPTKLATTQTSVSRIESPGYGTVGLAVHSSLLADTSLLNPIKDPKAAEQEMDMSRTALRDIWVVNELEEERKRHRNHIKTKCYENMTYHMEDSRRFSVKSALSRNSRFHKKRSDNHEHIIEVASKTCRNQKVTFTVEGVEPPKRLEKDNDSIRSLRFENVFNMHVLPGTSIAQGNNNVEHSSVSSGPKRESVDFDDSGRFYQFLHTMDDCKEKSKESSEISYKFKKKSWSSKEIPKVPTIKEKKKGKSKPKSKVKVAKTNMGVQTQSEESDIQVKRDKDIGVCTGPCVSREVQVQVALPLMTEKIIIPSVTRSTALSKNQSDSNISIVKEKYINKTDFPDYQELKPKVITKIPVRVPPPEIKSSSCESYRPCKPVSKPMRKHRSQRSRKYNTRNSVVEDDSRTRCHSVMSTGSIRNVTEITRKTRSKSLTHNNYLAEKVNINKETIKHHHKEIVALEKCLHEILHRLDRVKAINKESIREDSSPNTSPCPKSEISPIPSYESLTMSSCCHYQEGQCKVKKVGSAKKPIFLNHKHKSKTKTAVTLSKFHRAKAYNEKLRKRQQKSREHFKTFKQTTVQPVKVKSVFKNNRGFISSATSLSSKISEFGSSGSYPKTNPSLHLAFPIYEQPQSSSECTKRVPKYHKHGIVKKKHQIHPKASPFSRMKGKSIYDLLKQYINLVNDSPRFDPKHKPKISDLVLTPEESNGAVPSKSTIMRKSSPQAKYTKPFFMERTTSRPSKPTRELKKIKVPVTSEDSLESDLKSHNVSDLCPLTAIFNFQPPKTEYLVYNMEVISPNKPKVEVKPTSPTQAWPVRNQSPCSSESTTVNKLMTILEENPLPNWDVPPQLKAKATVAKQDIKSDEGCISHLSPILSRRVYPTYEACMKSLENLEDDIQDKTKSKLTTFNCNDCECSNLIFNYTSRKDAAEVKLGSGSKSPSSAYHTLTTIMDSRSASFRSASESDTAINTRHESGYESAHRNSFKKFFRNNLLDTFKSKIKKKPSEHKSISENQQTNQNVKLEKYVPSEEPFLENFKDILDVPASSEEEISEKQSNFEVKVDQDENPASEHEKDTFAQPSKTVLWFNFRKKKRDAGHGCDPWCTNRSAPTESVPTQCTDICTKKSGKCVTTSTWKTLGGLVKANNECVCNLPYDKQKELCKKYANKVITEASKREQGFKKQFRKFEELPLKVLMDSKECPCKRMEQTCKKSWANKTTGIQVKQTQKEEKIQAESVQHDVPLPSGRVPKKHEEKKVKTPEPSTPSLVAGHVPDIPSDEFSLEEGFGFTKTKDDPTVSGTRLYTDREIFERLLHDYERRDEIAERLTTDQEFSKDIYEAANAGEIPHLQVQEYGTGGTADDRTRGPRFSDKPRPLVHVANADTVVRPDDIGTCFARGFRPDNLMLSGDACFHINKQDKVKMSPYMLKSTESIIDFSERETPLDFLLALGFMVDEASNALKDDDIRSRLLAAITEARVWINKITTTQGTLLYLVAYKARPETMRYFLQLVEAIINKRITNAIRLDGFLRVLEDVEAGRIQMINILGEDKFEDEENEEKLVKKQLKNLFITVYNTAEKEAGVSGRTLNPNQIAMLRILVAKYRAGLHPHLELIARYIGQGLLENEIQLEAAMIFLSRLDTTEVKLKEFENYCGIACQLHET